MVPEFMDSRKPCENQEASVAVINKRVVSFPSKLGYLFLFIHGANMRLREGREFTFMCLDSDTQESRSPLALQAVSWSPQSGMFYVKEYCGIYS